MNRRDLLKISALLPSLCAAQPKGALAFFTPHQDQTVIAFSDIVIPATDTPGARQAQVNRYLDKLLAASPASFQKQFAGDLEKLDAFSRKTFGGDFVKLNQQQQANTLGIMFAGPDRPAFDRLKAWTARIYYATEEGTKELNKSGRPASYACA